MLAILIMLQMSCSSSGLMATVCPLDEDDDGVPGASVQLVLGKDCPFTATIASYDCNDSNPDVYPGAPELCDGTDNNCDFAEDLPPVTLYADADGDGYGDPLLSLTSCSESYEGYVTEAGDCDDMKPEVNPGLEEACDGLDNDCNGAIDEDYVWYADADGDGYGDPGTSIVSCDAMPPLGYVASNSDCNDADGDFAFYLGCPIGTTDCAVCWMTSGAADYSCTYPEAPVVCTF